MKLFSDVEIYGGVYTQNCNKDNISGNPGQRKSIPDWAYRQIAVCQLVYIGIAAINAIKSES